MTHARLAALVFFVAACGSKVASSPNDGGATLPGDGGANDGAAPSNGDGGGSDGGSACPAGDLPGKTFKLHVKNDGARALSLAYACGSLPPLTLVTTTGTHDTNPYGVNTCGVDCKAAYAGQGVGACSDCGPGYGASLAAGATVDLTWDHLVYVAQGIDPSCLQPPQTGLECALEQAVAPSASQQGTLTICTQPSSLGLGYCSKTEAVPFTIDTTGSEATIHVP